MCFVTIVQRNSERPLVYHGELLNKCESNFEVGVINCDGKREVWVCHYDYWNLIE